ncbi:thyrotropin-releasing hormone receptor-like [Mya arenaria]|uniref:thyrotropin-releasing hormone receptor-like n=1 Tax=Mya arenaria TaxID=6604 RepID=UPI0022E24DE9|nr:thyrotropin-releasing hormone receptor-like [Mya arenaria]
MNTTFVMDTEHNASNILINNEERSLSTILLAAKTMRTVFIPLIVVIGLCGNTLSLMVFSAQSMRRSSCSVFLASLAAVDNTFLVNLLFTWIDGEMVTIISTDILCQVLIYFTYVTSFLSVWFVVGFTCERYIAICFPLKRTFLCSVKREKIAVVALILAAFGLYNFSLWTSGMQQFGPKLKCSLKKEYFQVLNIVTWIDTLLTMVIPFVIIIIVNSLVLRTIIQGSLKSNALSRKSSFAQKKVGSFVILETMKKTFCKPTNPQIRVTRTLIMVSMTFLCLNLPSHAIRLCNLFSSVMSKQQTISEEYFLLQEVTLVLYYLTFSCNFVLYTLFGRNFKTSLMLILKCRSYTDERRRLILGRLSSNNSNTTHLV